MRLIEDESNSKSDLPWVNEYLERTDSEGYDVSPVESIKKTPKGLLVLCKDFKGFIFTGQQTYNHLIDAFSHWKSNPNLNFRLYGQALPSGKLAIGIEDKEESVVLIDKSGSYSFKQSGGEAGGKPVDVTNPFIPVSPVPTTSGKPKATK